MKELKMFTTSWCGFCRAEKDFLRLKGISFTEVDVEQDPKAAEEMQALSGQSGVPYTVITKDDGTKVGILGFDRARLSQMLDLS